MNKVIYFSICVLLLSIVMIGCSSGGTTSQMQYGAFEIDRVEHIPAFSSATPDYFLEKNIGTLFTVSKDGFSVDTADASEPSQKEVTYDNVTYVREDLEDATGYKVMSDSEDTGFRIYYLDEEVWIGHYSWYGQNNDAWWADYIFGVVPN
ncbi:MAG: hypothetical protein CVU86_07320 [Firmicutes bacterium HGW-Firmicutes-11]|nr:MAG: hypothetical protein CVU86_07320 [Firmicutes bacterium HGW-Firmicutes-11]